MYRPKDRKTPPLFPELFPLGGGLNANNRWIKLSGLIPWERLEDVYRGYFSEGMGRPAKDSRLICGLLIVKHAEKYADKRAVQEYLENPYVQAFCGEDAFKTEGGINPSLLSKLTTWACQPTTRSSDRLRKHRFMNSPAARQTKTASRTRKGTYTK